MTQEFDNTLYERLGEHNIKDLVDAFYERVYQHPVLIPLFDEDSIDEIKDKQFRFLTQFLGGPLRYIEKYGPPRMRMRHLPHKIDQNAMIAWLSCMKGAISTLSLSEENATELYNKFPQLAQHMVNS
ncbi:globin domain-containing protein [Brumimicrobium oceani]|uniref:Globin n=1 Tax=Brumimicrobium oceani TaxID=2100725 RepID=A0A2U2XCX5_9FLAO|nr:protoglobin domain-containing protein [Brumimicrobium oceani]PWH85623.1 globin [Brumimicrobium oceani]